LRFTQRAEGDRRKFPEECGANLGLFQSERLKGILEKDSRAPCNGDL